MANIRSWKHSGFSVDQSVRLEAGDQEGVQRLIQLMKIIAFIEPHQTEVIEKILRHCRLWEEGPARAPPSAKISVAG